MFACRRRFPALGYRLICAGGLALLASGNALAQEVTLRAGVFVPPHTTYGVPFKQWVDIVNRKGKGQIQVKILGGPEAIPGHELANAVRSGVLDVASVPPSYYKNLMVEGDAQILSNMTLAEQRKSGGFAKLNGLANQKLNAEYLTSYGLGVEFHIYLRKVVGKPGEIKGLRMRSQPNYTAFLKSLGADPANIPAPDVYTALERGVVDGYVWPLWGITDFNWQKFTKVRIHPGFYNVVVNILINKDKLSSLSGTQRKLLRDATAEFEAQYVSWAKKKTADVLKKQKDAGIKEVRFEKGFADLAYSSYWKALGEASPKNVAELRKLLVK